MLSQADKFFSVRGLSPQSLRLLRVFMHGCLALGAQLGGEAFVKGVAPTLNATYVPASEKEDPGGFFLAHLRSNWAVARELLDANDEQLTLLLHEALLSTDALPEGAVAAASAPGARDGEHAEAGPAAAAAPPVAADADAAAAAPGAAAVGGAPAAAPPLDAGLEAFVAWARAQDVDTWHAEMERLEELEQELQQAAAEEARPLFF